MGKAMTVPGIDNDYAARQILAVFARYKVIVGGILRRHQFFEVRDSDFQRGIDGAIGKGWIQRHERDRYRYILTATGRDAFNTVLVPTTAVAGDGFVTSVRSNAYSSGGPRELRIEFQISNVRPIRC